MPFLPLPALLHPMQRIAIARMMLKNAPIVILDEATAFTDPENENKIQKSIEELTKGIAANQPEKKEKIKPIYRFFLQLPHQSMILFTVPNMILHLLSGFQLPSALLPHGPATFSDKADSSESVLPEFLLLLYSHFSKQRFCLHL